LKPNIIDLMWLAII